MVWLESGSGWKRADDETRETEAFKAYSRTYLGGTDEDVREWLELAFENMAGAKIFVYIVPEERSGRVRNIALVHVDHPSGG